MKFSIVKLHFWVGIFGVLIFLATGLYMRFGLNSLQDMADLPRMAYRTGHIYILMMALLNLIIGIYGQTAYARSTGWCRQIKRVSSALFLIVLPMSIYSFFTEPVMAQVERPLGAFAVIFVFAACILSLLSEALQD